MKPLWKLPTLPGVIVIELGDDGGAFILKSPVDKQVLSIIASHGLGWDHVSVSRRSRIPIWDEMEFVKRLFFEDDEVAMQLHVPAADHVNVHPNTIHLWRPQIGSIPLPPHWMV